jgi:hypothetical protein
MLFKDFTWSPEDLVSQEAFIGLAEDNQDTHIFMHTDSIENNMRTQFRGIISPPVFPPPQRIWITGMSDYSINTGNSVRFDGLYDKWYGINVDRISPKIQIIPLGADTHSDMALFEDKERVLYEVSKKPVEPSDTLAYMNFNAYTYLAERGLIHMHFKEVQETWIKMQVNEKIPYREYCESVRNHKFTFCPRGNGIDTHRFWESIYLGSIPIVIDYPQMSYFFDRLPIVKAPSWFQITEEFLEAEYERIHETDYDFDIMKMGFWRNMILSSE